MLKAENNNLTSSALPVLTMPEDLRKFVLTNCTNPSPYNRIESGSFYDCSAKSWGYTPDGSIRVSDHWNFYSKGGLHCQTDVAPEKLQGKWAVAKYSATTGLYHVISVDDKDKTALGKYQARKMRERQEDVNEIREKRIAKLNRIRKEKEAAIRAKKIQNGAKGNKGTKLWAEVEVNVWSRKRGRNYHQGTEILVGYLTWESKSGKSFVIKSKGVEREIRSTVSYRELRRKPR